MITKEQALENVKKYLSNRKVKYINIDTSDDITLNNNITIVNPNSKYYHKTLNTYTISYYQKGYDGDLFYYIEVDADTGAVLYTATEHGYID